jgi:Domain of unknown function (DUF4214)
MTVTIEDVRAQVTRLYDDVFDRVPDPGGLNYWTNEILSGALSLQDVRIFFANSREGQVHLVQLYDQVLDRAPATGELAAATNALANGETLDELQTALANGAEAQGDLTQLYHDKLGRAPEPSGLAAWTGRLANGMSLDDIRIAIAHSREAQGDLTTNFRNVEGRGPDMAELAGMENQLANSGATLMSVAADLAANGPSGFTIITLTASSGNDLVMTALPTPEEFDFGSWVFAKTEKIAGFDPMQDAIVLKSGSVKNFATLQADMTAVSGGTLITFDASHSLTLGGVAPSSLVAANFRFV